MRFIRLFWSSLPFQGLDVTASDFKEALANLTPSLSVDELERYLAIKRHYDAQQGFTGM
jgi:hypothetical protein